MRTLAALSPAIALLVFLCGPAAGQPLPVRVPALPQLERSPRNPMTWQELHRVLPSSGRGLKLELPGGLQGRIMSGPYPFEYGESGYDYPRYRGSGQLSGGSGTIAVGRFFAARYNANDWPRGQCAEPSACPTPTVGYRVEIKGRFYDGRTAFARGNGTWVPGLSIVEGPFVALVRSDQPGRASIALETDDPASCEVRLSGPKECVFAEEGPARNRHEIRIDGLRPGTGYRYQVTCSGETGRVRSGTYSFQSAPPPGGSETPVVFAFGSDSREGPGGEAAFMGHNRRTLSRISEDAHRRGADLLIFGGDLVDGYSDDPEDFRMQLKGWKKSVEGFWRSRPVYTAMGNHEALVNVFDDGTRWGLEMDKWPYGTASAEALFAREFHNPRNGPRPADPRRPPYAENVYTFQYGPVQFIALNNNYWWTTDDKTDEFGGSPEGYMLDDQLDWMERRLRLAGRDDSVAHVVLFMQEPVFPAGGHVGDAMWHGGDNNVRAYARNREGDLEPAGPGVIEVRNRFWRAVSRSSKVAAVLVGDEHAYHRMLVDRETPVGVPARDDPDGDGVLERCSPNPEFQHPVWQICAGNAGAPWYAREETPWEVERYVSRTGYLLFEATRDKLSMTAYALRGDAVMDRVDDLSAVKRREPGRD